MPKISAALYDDNFLTVLRNGMVDYAKTKDGVTLQIEDAQNDVGKQLNQIQNFIASGVDAIILNPVDTDATVSMSQAAADAGIPLIYVNRQPVNLDSLHEKQAFVASDEKESGTLETQEVCRLLKEAGKTEAKIVVMMGELSNQAARHGIPVTETQAGKSALAQAHAMNLGASGSMARRRPMRRWRRRIWYRCRHAIAGLYHRVAHIVPGPFGGDQRAKL